ncbi:LysM peptidoglycan-binding domain-containing protein [Paenibacillus sp. NPDC058177]|uniref:LysM peptidoglycan-binding domain-containing protein n=1 Tax=Paenibacillus sp. NPDC058177 TaxID=3346369 RepID=UPI0036DEE555
MKIHIVKQGDTLYALSQKYGVPLEKIIEANPQLSNPDVLSVGEKVKIPSSGPSPVPGNSDLYYKHTVKQGDTLWKLSKAWGVPLKDVVDANPQLKNPNALLIGEVVNIPKKETVSPLPNGNIAPIQNENVTPVPAANAVSEKTQVGGKTYTGPKEQPAPPVAPLAESVPAPVPAPAPTPAPVPIAKPNPNPNPNLSPASNINPNPAPVPVNEPVPNAVSPIAEVVPVKETIHTESQSLFVQISVPAQEAISHHEPPKSEYKPVAPVFEEKKSPCDHSAGYPGLTETSPFHGTTAPNVNLSPQNNYVQPSYVQPWYAPDCPPFYYYPEWVSPVTENQSPWHTNVSPVTENQSPWHTNVSPVAENQSPWHTNVSPVAENQSPWHTNVSPATENQSPWHTNVSPVAENQSPWHTNVSPAAENQSPWHTNVSPAAENQSPWHTNVSPVAENQSPWHTNVSPAVENQSPWHNSVNAAPNDSFVSGIQPNNQFPGAVSPQYSVHPQNLPWPPCGCGGEHPYQPFTYEAPIYNSFPTYGHHPGVVSPYETGAPFSPNQGIVPNAPLGAFGGGGPALSNIPPNPQYPGIGDYAHHSRVPEIQEPEVIIQESQPIAATTTEVPSKRVVEQKESKKVEVASKAKTSGQSKSGKSSGKSQRSSKSNRNDSAKKRRNPWISN